MDENRYRIVLMLRNKKKKGIKVKLVEKYFKFKIYVSVFKYLCYVYLDIDFDGDILLDFSVRS